MGPEYSPFNLLIWSLFALFVVITYLTVKVFHRRYPNYPKDDEKDEE
jgi:hypothetical protein